MTRFLLSWRDAWARQDADAYLAFYASDCIVDGRERADFEAHKRRIFSRGTPLRVELGDLRVSPADLEGEALLRARFDQDYTSSLLSDFGRKELLLRPAGDSYLIVSESWSAATGTIQAPLGERAAAAPRAAARQGAPAGDEPLLGAGYAPPVTEASARPAPASEALSMDPLLGPSLDIVSPDYGLPKDEGSRSVVEEIVATINGEILTRSMLVQRIGWYEATLLEDNPPDLDEQMAHLSANALDATIDRWLILQEARTRSADLEGFWREWLAQFRRQVEAKDMAELEALLKEQGSSLAELRQQVLETEVPNVYLQQAIGEALTFTEAEIEAYFNEHRARYERAKSTRLRQIVIPVEAGSDPQRARAVAEAAVAALREGKDWCEVHEIYSSGGPACGDIGSIAVDDLMPELRAAAAGIPVGSVSLPILTAQGWHLLNIIDREGAEPVSFGDARDRALADLRESAYQERMQSYLDDLRKNALISLNPRYPTSRQWNASAESQAGQ